MPRTALATPPVHHVFQTDAERAFLNDLQRQALQYFLDNQTPRLGLALDRQRNFGPRLSTGLYSTAATGMGFMALALASAEPFRLLSTTEAIARVRVGIEASLETLPHTHGMLPHFVDSTTGAVAGCDARSTIDSGWLIAGALWAAEFLDDAELRQLSERLYRRVDWKFWTAPSGLIRHGADRFDEPLPSVWDRLNGETVFLYVLAAGAEQRHAWPARNWLHLGTFPGEAGGLRFGSADLGLFVFQYGLDLLDLSSWRLPLGQDLPAQATVATEANARTCRALAPHFRTYDRYWGLSAGDGPGDSWEDDTYRCYSPAGPLDGTAHLSATVASIAYRPDLVWENLHQADRECDVLLRGRYGLSSVNLDRHWVAADMVGIDAGAVIIALDNCLHDDRVRKTFHRVSCVRRGLERIGCVQAPARLRVAS